MLFRTLVTLLAASGLAAARPIDDYVSCNLTHPQTMQSRTMNQPPEDVACLATLLPWQVTADNFGRHVADQFLAFQVLVRNLNPTNEFLLHSVSFAQDNGGFHPGVDKTLIRNSQAHGQLYDRRNFVTRLLEVLAGAAAGTQPYDSAQLAAGLGSFRTLVVPGVERLFPDRYPAQINALNDLAFSSATTNTIIVPPKSAAPFVTFLPAALFADRDPYKRWSAAELRKFQQESNIIVAGVHIQEVAHPLQ